MNDNWKDMEKSAAESQTKIKIPAIERLETISFSFSETKENNTTIIMMSARWVEEENPEKMAYPESGKRLNIPAIFFDLPEIVSRSIKDKIR